MTDKIVFIKAEKGGKIMSMDLPVSGTALAIDVFQNIQSKYELLRNLGFTNIDMVYGYPVRCSWCQSINGASECEHSHGICPACAKIELDDYQKHVDQVTSL
jgi:hypothetical protein